MTVAVARRVWIRHAMDGRWYYALVLRRARPRDRRDILERGPLRESLLGAIMSAELLAHGMRWRVVSVAPLPARAFAR